LFTVRAALCCQTACFLGGLQRLLNYDRRHFAFIPAKALSCRKLNETQRFIRLMAS
jgi:hypothetical protein